MTNATEAARIRKQAQRERDKKAGYVRPDLRIHPDDRTWFHERAAESRRGELKK